MNEITIKEIKKRWLSYCVNTNQRRAKTQDYHNLQYIDKLISDGLDNDTINTRLERYRKIRITDESLNKKRGKFNKRMSTPRKRVDLTKIDWKISFKEEIDYNPYYNQKVVWCNNCGRTHRINSDIAWDHNTKPIPIKCEVDEDHCWKLTYDENNRMIIYFSGLSICLQENKNIFLFYPEAVAEECIVCGRRGLETLSFIDKQPTEDKQNKLFTYIQSVKDLGFDKLNEMSGSRFKGKDIQVRIPKFDEKVREIQHIQDYYVIRNIWDTI